MASRAKRAKARKDSAECLQKHGIRFYTNNYGVHLIVQEGKYRIDFWPGTGKWKCRSGPEGFGVENLLTYIHFCCKAQ